MSFKKGTKHGSHGNVPDRTPKRAKFQSAMQSAMEYLLTYGWSILILSFVLAALYYLGIFNSVSLGGSSCISQVGYLCTGIRFSTNYNDPCGGTLFGGVLSGTSTGYPSVNVTVGTAQGPYSNIYIAMIPNGQIITDTSIGGEGNPNDFLYWETVVGRGVFVPSTVSTGQLVTVPICISPSLAASGSIGKHITGVIWVMYSTPYAVNAVAQVGTFSVAAVR